MVRAKFKLSKIEYAAGTTGKNFVFFPVHDTHTPENERFTKYTPSGKLEMWVDNPPAEDQFMLGDDYYLDFSPVPKA